MLAVAVGSALLILLILASIRRNRNSGLRNIPNAHFSVPYSRLWLLTTRWRKVENRTRVQIHRLYGPVVRIAPTEVSVNCIDEGVRIIYSSKFDKDPSFYHALIDKTGFMVTMIGNEEHRRRRRMLAHPYANSYIISSKTLDNILCRVKGHLREGMATWAAVDTSVDVYQIAKRCMLDVASGWLFGSENATDTLRDPSFENALTTLAIASNQNLHMRTIFEGPLYRIVSLMGGTVPLNPDARDQWAGWLTRVVTDSYTRHSTKTSGSRSLYDHFYDCFKGADPEMSANDMASLMAVECDDHLSATHIGLGILLSYIMYELSRKQDWQQALRKELLTLAEPSDESLAQRRGNLKVLDAVVTETMRTRAPCPGPFPRVVPSTGCRLVGKYDLPGGTVVSSSAWALHFNPLPFPNPDEWLPGRWLESSENTVTEMRKWIWTFGSGARVCIGTHFSMRVIKEIVAAIYTDFETILDETSTDPIDQEDVFSASPYQHSLKLKFCQLKKI